MPADLSVRGTIALATLTWAAAEYLRLCHPSRAGIARTLWTAGSVLATIHAVAAFHYVHHWSHDAALADTARQTAALTGLKWSGGLYVNYGFLMLWLFDAFLWWRHPETYRRRPPAFRDALLAVFVFMFVNGGIVFARGAGRALGVVAVGAVVWARYAGRAGPAKKPDTTDDL